MYVDFCKIGSRYILQDLYSNDAFCKNITSLLIIAIEYQLCSAYIILKTFLPIKQQELEWISRS